jgi:hypothetical protein
VDSSDIHSYLLYLLVVVLAALVGGLVKLAIIRVALRNAEPKDRPEILRSLAPLFGRKIELRLSGDRRDKPESTG